MFKYTCLNPIAAIGLNNFTDGYEKTDNFADAQAVLVRSASMHDSELSDNLLAVARAGAGYNNIPVDKCADKGIVVFNTPGANANGVKELLLQACFLQHVILMVVLNGLKKIKTIQISVRIWKRQKNSLQVQSLWARRLV